MDFLNFILVIASLTVGVIIVWTFSSAILTTIRESIKTQFGRACAITCISLFVSIFLYNGIRNNEKALEEQYETGYSEAESEYKYSYDSGYEDGYNTGYSDCAYDYNLEVSDDTYDNCGTDYESTWGDLIDANGGEPVWGTLTQEQKALVNYPYFDINKVYYVPDGENFHSVEWCYTLEKSKTIYSCTYGEALDYGLDSCSKCIYE